MIWCKNLYIYIYIYIYIFTVSIDDESQEKHCRVYSTTDDVKLSHTYLENVHIFTANRSPFILQEGNGLQLLNISTSMRTLCTT